MLFEIKHRYSGAVLFALETTSMKLCVQTAIKSGSNLSYSDLRGSDLSGSDLRGSNLSYSDLSYSNLSYSDLSGSNLSGAKIREDITVQRAPIQISGLTWPVIIWDHHMQIGCEFHSYSEWAAFSDQEWIKMGAKLAIPFKRQNFAAIELLCAAHAEDKGWLKCRK